MLMLYIDDILLARSNLGLLREIKDLISENFNTKDMGEHNLIIGIKIHCKRSFCHARALSKVLRINVFYQVQWKVALLVECLELKSKRKKLQVSCNERENLCCFSCIPQSCANMYPCKDLSPLDILEYNVLVELRYPDLDFCRMMFGHWKTHHGLCVLSCSCSCLMV